MGQVPPKDFLPAAPIGASAATNTLNPAQKAPQNAQTPLLPPNFTDPGTSGMASATQNPFNPFTVSPTPAQNGPLPGNSPLFGGSNQANPLLKGLFQ